MAFPHTQEDIESLAETLRPGEVDDDVRAGVEAIFNFPDFQPLYDWIAQRIGS